MQIKEGHIVLLFEKKNTKKPFPPSHSGKSRDPQALTAPLGLRWGCPAEQPKNGNEENGIYSKLVKDIRDNWYSRENTIESGRDGREFPPTKSLGQLKSDCIYIYVIPGHYVCLTYSYMSYRFIYLTCVTLQVCLTYNISQCNNNKRKDWHRQFCFVFVLPHHHSVWILQGVPHYRCYW